MAEYRKKPVVVEAWPIADLLQDAVQNWSGLPPQVTDAYERGDIIFLANGLQVRTLEGMMTGDRVDWLICGVQGELYPCKPDIFEATYEAVE